MKYSNLAAFEKHLEGAAPNHFSDIYLIQAKEPFIRKQATDRLVSLVLKDGGIPGISLYLFDAERDKIEVVMQELQAMAMFAKKRLIAVHNADAYSKAATLQLEAYCTSPDRATCLVITAEALNRATTFYKKLEKVGIVLDVPEEKPWEKEKSVADWLQMAAMKEGKQLGPQVVQMLIKQLGTDQMLLSNELLKLVCYVGSRPTILDTDVAAISSVVNPSNGWQLGEAIFRRDAAAALGVSKALLAEGSAIIGLLRQIRFQFQTQYQICSILASGGTPADVTNEFPYMKGMALERNVRQSQQYGMQRFKKGLLAIDEAELQAKNSAMDHEFLAEKLIITLTI